VAVKKAWGKKNPEIQKAGGEPFSIHFVRKSILSSRSSCQEARGFRDRNPLVAHESGT
jgi:hypothetical protein